MTKQIIFETDGKSIQFKTFDLTIQDAINVIAAVTGLLKKLEEENNSFKADDLINMGIEIGKKIAEIDLNKEETEKE